MSILREPSRRHESRLVDPRALGGDVKATSGARLVATLLFLAVTWRETRRVRLARAVAVLSPRSCARVPSVRWQPRPPRAALRGSTSFGRYPVRAESSVDPVPR